VSTHSNRPSSLSPQQFERIRVMVESELGVQLPPSKRAMVQARLARRCRELGLERADQYCAYLFGGSAAGEATHLLDAITTNFTYFYREPQQLDLFAADLLPGLVDTARSERRPLRLWCAASSTGEEVWTLAMLAQEAAAQRAPGVETRIWASDVSTRVLETATRAVYRVDALEKLPVGWQDRYFLRSRDASTGRVRVVPELRRCATFHNINLMAQTYPVPGELDAVFIRNVLIYFDAETRRAVVERVCRHLRPGGLLFLGASEAVTGTTLPLRPLGRAIYQRKRDEE